MINLNINLSIKLEQLADSELRSQFIKAVSLLHNEMADYGLPVTIKAPSAPRITSNASTEKGQHELAFLESTGQKRMKVPSTWTGSREAYAESRLNGGTVDSHADEPEETEADGVDTFH